MKLFTSLSVLSALSLLTFTQARAQSECAEYHKFNCERSNDPRFSLNGQSKSASVQISVPTELNIIVYRGQDYRISFCFDEKVLGDHLMVRLIEKVRVPRVVEEEVTEKEEVLDAEGNPTGEMRDVKRKVKKTVYEDTDKVVWDNSEHELAQEVEFTATSTKRLVVQVTAPGATDPKGRARDLDIGCVGILIEHMTTPPMGF